MSFLPSDWPSFLLGIVVGGLAAFFTGFLKKLGEDAWGALKGRLFPKPPEPVLVPTDFEPTLFKPGSCEWVREEYLSDKKAQRYTYYPHPNGGAPCYRVVVGMGHNQNKEFLMAKPDAKLRDT